MARLKCQRCTRTFDGRADARYCGPSCRSAAAKERRQTRANTRTGHPLAPAVTRSLKAAKTTPADAAAAALARVYARRLDANPDALDRLGPQLLAVLVQMGMTPRARADSKTGGQVDRDGARPESELERLRARHDRRQQRAAALDATA